MRKTNKKGFTIVELVVVIAVIAILAAVLIPTFSGIIRKANISSDTVVAKNLNTAAIAAGADTYEAAIDAVEEAGYIVANLNAKTNKVFFVWEDSSNQFILVDGEKNYEVIYSNSDDYAALGNTWYFAISDSEMVNEIEALGANVFYTPKNQEALIDAFNKLMEKDGKQTVFVVDNMDLTKGGEIFKLTKSTADITVDLAGKTINCAGAVDTTVEFGKADRAFTVNAGKLTVANGTVNAGDSYGTVKAEGSVNVIVFDMDLVNSKAGGLNLKAIGANAAIDVSDTVITASLGGGCEAAGGKIDLTNVTIIQTGTSSTNTHCSTAIAASGGTGVVNVNSGTYSSENSVLYVFSSGGTINVKDGIFSTTGNVLFTVTKDSSATENSVIRISGGTFTVGTTTKTFEELDKTWLESVTDGETSIEKVDGAWVITK